MNYQAHVTGGSSWLSIASGASGGNSGIINVQYSANTEVQRSGTIQVTASGAKGSPAALTVIQLAPMYGVDYRVDSGTATSGMDLQAISNYGGFAQYSHTGGTQFVGTYLGTTTILDTFGPIQTSARFGCANYR
jgi:Putative binding domain, N-terminal